MCGIFSFSRTDESTRRMTGILADRMESRGHDSWGVTDGDFIYKETGRITEGWQELDLEGPTYHTRAASCGAVSQRNAHPFDFTHEGLRVVGVHNGHISNWQALKDKYKRKDLEVDSEHIFMHLAEGRSLGDIDGWGAVIWYETDAAGRTRRFASKFGQGDNLHIAKLLNNTLVMASTASSIETASRFANVGIKHFYTIKDCWRYEILGEELMDGGAMDWKKDVQHASWAPAERQHNSSGVRRFMANVCAAPACSTSVASDRLICRPCMQELLTDYGTSWAAV